MALSRVKSWSSGEVLTASDLNSEFNNILNNARSLISPLTGSLDMDGYEFILDGDADSSLTADTDDKLDLRLGAFDSFIFDGTTASSVNGITFTTAATGNGATIASHGETNVPITLRGKGTGRVILGQATATGVQLLADQPITDSNNNELLKFTATGSAVNEFTVVNAATGNRPQLKSSGESNTGLELRDSNSNELLIFESTASAVNEVAITNNSTGAGPVIKSSGETNVPLNLRGKGTGNITLQDGADATKQASFVLTGVTAGQNRTITMVDANVDLQYARAASDTVAGGIEIATEAEMETGTDTGRAVVPGRQHRHAGHPKFWALVSNPGGVPSLTSSYNVTSITDTAAGRLTVTIATDFSSADWCCVPSGDFDISGGFLFVVGVDSGSRAVGSVIIECVATNDAGGGVIAADPPAWHIVGYGDQS